MDCLEEDNYTMGSFTDKINMQLMGRFSRQGANR